MFRSYYTAVSGMTAQQLNIDTITNNLANVNTTSFKKARVDFQDLLYANLIEPGALGAYGSEVPVGTQVGMGVRSVSSQRLFNVGSLQQTGDPMNVAINGNGFFEVTLPDGTRAYTRDGALKLDGEGNLLTAGYSLGVKIPKNAANILVREDGSVTANLPGKQEPGVVGQLHVARFLNPGGLKAIGQNLYIETVMSGQKYVGKPGENELGPLLSGHLEKSNINVVEEMIALIQAQRAYEMNSKGVQSSDEMMRMTNQINK